MTPTRRERNTEWCERMSGLIQNGREKWMKSHTISMLLYILRRALKQRIIKFAPLITVQLNTYKDIYLKKIGCRA